MATSTYRFSRTSDGTEVQLVVDGKPCPGRLGLLSGRPGQWEAEWVDGSRVGVFKTRLEAAGALSNFRYTI